MAKQPQNDGERRQGLRREEGDHRVTSERRQADRRVADRRTSDRPSPAGERRSGRDRRKGPTRGQLETRGGPPDPSEPSPGGGVRVRSRGDMIPRYTHPEMGRIWGDQRKYDAWLRVEVAAAEAMAAIGLIPVEAARDIAACDGVRAERIDVIEQATQHDVIAFTTAVAERVGPSARWLHFGLTSSDVLDTALALQMREACGLILDDLDGLLSAIRDRAPRAP